MATKARYLADLLNASGELDSTGAVESIQDNISTLFAAGSHTGIAFTYDDSNATFSAAVTQDAQSAGFYHKVTVTVSGGNYLMDGTANASVVLSPSVTYRFDLSDSSCANHPLRFSTTSDGTHNSGAEISAGYTTYSKTGTPGSAGAYTQVCFEQDQTNPLYYYCSAHSGMGGTALLGIHPNTDTITEGSTNQYHTSERVQDITGAQLATNGSHTGITATYDDAGDGAIDLALVTENVEDIVGAMFSSNTESGISVTYEDGDGTIDLDVNDPTISLTGDVTGSATMTNLGNTSIAATIAANSVAMGTDTTGNYVATVAGTTNEITVSGSGSETAAVTVSLPDDVTIGNDLTVTGEMGSATIATSGNAVIGGNLTVSGTTTTVSSSTVAITDNNMKVAKDNSANTTDFGVYGVYNDGSTRYAGINWDGSESDKFRLYHGTTTEPTTVVDPTATGWTKGTLIADLEGNSSTASALATARTIAVSGDVVGSASFDGSGNIDLSTVIQANSVALGTDTTGNYMTDLSAGEGIDITHTAAEGSTATITAEIATDSNKGVAQFNTTDFTVTSGEVAINAERIQDTAGAMFTGNTETGITATYQDGDGTVDLVVSGTLATIVSDGTEAVQDIAGAMFTSNTETGITATYDDSDGTIDLVVSGTLATIVSDGTEAVQDIAGAQLATNGSHTGITATYDDSNDGAIDLALVSENVQDIVGAMFSSNTETGIAATYEDGDGTIDLVVSGAAATIVSDFTEAVQDVVGAMVSSNTESGIGVTYEDGDGTLDFNVSDPTLSYTGDVTGSGTMTDLGNTSIALTIAATSVENSMLAGSIANSKLSNSSITVSDGSNSTATSLGGTITFAGTSNEVDVAESSGTITYGLPSDVTISNDLTVSGDLTVTGSTTQTGSIVSDSNFTGLTDANSGNSTDFGFYGKYVESSTTKYGGIFYDASTDNTFRLFSDTQTVPSTTVNTGATGYTAANLVVGTLTGNVTGNVTGSLTGNATTATTLATSRNISGVAFDGSANITLDTDDIGEGSSNLYHTSERVADVVGAMVSSNTESGISVTYDDSDNTLDFNVADPTIALTGDVTGSATMTDLGNVSISTSQAADSVDLGTHTTGNYVDNVTGGTGVTVTGSAGEGWEPAISIGQAVATSSNVTFADVAATGNVTITGNLTVNGSQTTVNSSTLSVTDLNIIVGKDASTLAATDGAGLTFGAHGSAPTFTWDNGNARLSANKQIYSSGGFVGNVTGNASGTAATVTGAAQTAITSVGTLTGLAVSGAATTSYTTIGSSAKAFRNIYMHSSAPSGGDGAVGDLWITY